MLSTVVNVIALCLILIPVLMMYYKNHTTDFNTIKKDEISKGECFHSTIKQILINLFDC